MFSLSFENSLKMPFLTFSIFFLMGIKQNRIKAPELTKQVLFLKLIKPANVTERVYLITLQAQTKYFTYGNF